MTDRRADILNTSLRLFLEKGFYGTSTREICREVGISSGLFFHYFPTKEAVFEELVRIGFASISIDLEKAIADPKQYVTETLDFTLGMLRDKPESARVFLFMNQAQSLRGVSSRVDAMFEEHDLIRSTVPVFEEGQRQGVFRDGQPLQLAVAFWTSLQGLAEELAINPDFPVPPASWYLDLVAKER